MSTTEEEVRAYLDPRRPREAQAPHKREDEKRKDRARNDQERMRDGENWKLIKTHLAIRDTIQEAIGPQANDVADQELIEGALRNLQNLVELPAGLSRHVHDTVLRGVLNDPEYLKSMGQLKDSLKELRTEGRGRAPTLHEINELYRRHGDALEHLQMATATPGASQAIAGGAFQAAEHGKLAEKLRGVKARHGQAVEGIASRAMSSLVPPSQDNQDSWALAMGLLNDCQMLLQTLRPAYQVPMKYAYRLTKIAGHAGMVASREGKLWLPSFRTERPMAKNETENWEEIAARRLDRELRQAKSLPGYAHAHAKMGPKLDGKPLSVPERENYYETALAICHAGRREDAEHEDRVSGQEPLEGMARDEVLEEAADRIEAYSRMVSAARALHDTGKLAGTWLKAFPKESDYDGEPGAWKVMASWATLEHTVPEPGADIEWHKLRTQTQEAWNQLPREIRKVIAEEPSFQSDHERTTASRPGEGVLSDDPDQVKLLRTKPETVRWMVNASRSVHAIASRIGVSGGISGHMGEEVIASRRKMAPENYSVRERFRSGATGGIRSGRRDGQWDYAHGERRYAEQSDEILSRVQEKLYEGAMGLEEPPGDGSNEPDKGQERDEGTKAGDERENGQERNQDNGTGGHTGERQRTATGPQAGNNEQDRGVAAGAGHGDAYEPEAEAVDADDGQGGLRGFAKPGPDAERAREPADEAAVLAVDADDGQGGLKAFAKPGPDAQEAREPTDEANVLAVDADDGQGGLRAFAKSEREPEKGGAGPAVQAEAEDGKEVAEEPATPRAEYDFEYDAVDADDGQGGWKMGPREPEPKRQGSDEAETDTTFGERTEDTAASRTAREAANAERGRRGGLGGGTLGRRGGRDR